MKIILKIINDSETSKKKKKNFPRYIYFIMIPTLPNNLPPYCIFSAENKGEILYSNIRWLTLCTFTGSRF